MLCCILPCKWLPCRLLRRRSLSPILVNDNASSSISFTPSAASLHLFLPKYSLMFGERFSLSPTLPSSTYSLPVILSLLSVISLRTQRMKCGVSSSPDVATFSIRSLLLARIVRLVVPLSICCSSFCQLLYPYARWKVEINSSGVSPLPLFILSPCLFYGLYQLLIRTSVVGSVVTQETIDCFGFLFGLSVECNMK